MSSEKQERVYDFSNPVDCFDHILEYSNQYSWEVVEAADAFINLHNQVLNGGFYQWYDNKYYEEHHEIIEKILNSILNSMSEKAAEIDNLGEFIHLYRGVQGAIEDYGDNSCVCDHCGRELRCACGAGLPDWLQEIADEYNNKEMGRLFDIFDGQYYKIESIKWLILYYTLIKMKYLDKDIKAVVV